MSYARWSHSIWYAYWSASSRVEKDNQTLEFCTLGQLEYQDLKLDSDICRRFIIQRYLEETSKIPSDSEILELEGILEYFIEDVEESFIHIESLYRTIYYKLLQSSKVIRQRNSEWFRSNMKLERPSQEVEVLLTMEEMSELKEVLERNYTYYSNADLKMKFFNVKIDAKMKVFPKFCRKCGCLIHLQECTG